MNWEVLVENAELIYASTIDDEGFRTWSLKQTICDILFYESYPVEDIDRVVCGILEENNGILEEKTMATLLGFNVVDDFKSTPKRYADTAELDVFRDIIKPVIDWGLVEQEKTKEPQIFLKLTALGYRALSVMEKYKFFSGQKDLLENANIKPAELKENLLFPFYKALGVSSEITRIVQIRYEHVNIEDAFEVKKSELIIRHNLQSSQSYNIYKSEPSKYFEFTSTHVDIRLFKQGPEYFPVIFYNDRICTQATELLNSAENLKAKEKKTEWGLYLKLINDPNAVLDYETVIPFEDLLELDSLIKDTRLQWNDKKLFYYISENANANQWFSISNFCPIEILKDYLQTYNDKLDWTTLSLKVDDDFLVQNATHFPWNFEAISSKENVSIEVIKTLLQIPELKGREWDWEQIMPLLDFEFVKRNIDIVDFDLSELTKVNNDSVKELVVLYPQKQWNWSFISTEYDITFIFENISKFDGFLDLKTIIDRAFVTSSGVELFCQSATFEKLLLEAKEHGLKDYQPNQANYFWSEKLINLLEKTGYLNWSSGTYVLGFECNPFINWDVDFFTKHHLKIQTQKGFDFVSQAISDSRIVNKFLDFNWNWEIISANTNLINNAAFILSVKEKLLFSTLLKVISGQTLSAIFEEANILDYLKNDPLCWTGVTEKVSKEFILQHIDYDWDWHVLTKRFCSDIKIDSLGNPKWINKWDWVYLTQNIDFTIIVDKLDSYRDYWDWDYLSTYLGKEYVINKLVHYTDFWNWDILLNQRLDKTDLQLASHLVDVAICVSTMDDNLKLHLWQIITQKFDYNELDDLILQTYNETYFYWDYDYFYNLPSFNPRQYLFENVHLVDWKAFSRSIGLNNSFKWDRTLFNYSVWLKDLEKLLKNPNYLWDFKSLSKLESINWNDSVLSIETEKWDWEYLSQFSACFKKDERFLNRFFRFVHFIDFRVFSKRLDSEITEKLLTKTIDYDWDWHSLSENTSAKFSLAFINTHKQKSWNWEALSARNDINFDNETFIKLSDINWNWEAISNRADLIFSEELVTILCEKPLNWHLVSQNSSFTPNAKTLSILKGQNLDWDAISKNENLSFDILWDFKDRFDWQSVTKNQIIDFTDIPVLLKYQDYVVWDIVSQSDKFEPSINNLKQFKNKLNWSIINSRTDFTIANEFLEEFSEFLDWSNVSKSMEIEFNEALIEKYRTKWDWQLLRNNPQIIDRLGTTLRKYKTEFRIVEFIEQFPEPPQIYHFTHLFNAVNIIKERKILSRNKAAKQFANAAGNLVDRRSTAHNYARFYFRPQTPTQFYNECLGWDNYLYTSYGKSYYSQARNLGLPKCPIPVFFKFDLKEVLMKMADKCYYSTGNMQTDRARVYKVADNPNFLQTNYLFNNISDAFNMAGGRYNYDKQRHLSIIEKIKENSQQEFLVLEEFDFSQLESFEIICYNEEYEKLLKSQLDNDPVCKKIISDDWHVFHRGNRELIITETDSEISISSEYRDRAYLSISGEGIKQIEILNPDNIQKETTNEIIAYPEIKFTKTKLPIEVHFVDTVIETRDWLVYKN